MAYNYKYAKLDESGALEYAPHPLVIDDVKVWTNIESAFNELGFYKIEKTEAPIKEGFYYTDYWELSDNKIIQKWEEHEEPEPEPTEEEQYAEAAKILLGEAE